MNLALLATVVAAGIALVVIVVHLTGGSKRAVLVDARMAKSRFAQDFPNLVIDSVYVTQDGLTAFLGLRIGRVGVVQSMGDRFFTRLVGAGDLAGAPRSSAQTLTMQFRDFTWRGGAFAFDDVATAYAVEALFAPLRSRSMWENA